MDLSKPVEKENFNLTSALSNIGYLPSKSGYVDGIVLESCME